MSPHMSASLSFSKSPAASSYMALGVLVSSSIRWSLLEALMACNFLFIFFLRDISEPAKKIWVQYYERIINDIKFNISKYIQIP
jgi:hypothetical protein